MEIKGGGGQQRRQPPWLQTIVQIYVILIQELRHKVMVLYNRISRCKTLSGRKNPIPECRRKTLQQPPVMVAVVEAWRWSKPGQTQANSSSSLSATPFLGAAMDCNDSDAALVFTTAVMVACGLCRKSNRKQKESWVLLATGSDEHKYDTCECGRR